MRVRDLDRESRTAWISQGFERLVSRVRASPREVHFDVLIVGSGYGGAISAATLAGRKSGDRLIAVGVLERGDEYLPGSFPTGLGELPGHIRRDNNKEGLFDVRLGGDVAAVVANGVGGGSLINAGVMKAPLPSVFCNGWPSQLSDYSAWNEFFDRARELLGATIKGVPNTILDHPDGIPQKFQAIRAIAPPENFQAAPITIAMRDSTSWGNVKLNKCVRCGDCATGCNFGAKNSLDVNLLVEAQQAGAEIFSGATVLSLEKDGANWIVNSVYTNAALRARDRETLKIRARKIVLAAGTLGSSEILMRSRELGLPLSHALGTQCSTNGDMLISDYATADVVHTVADEAIKPSARAIGPTITGVVDLRDSAGVMIEEMSVPAALRVAFSEIFATVNTLHNIGRHDFTRHAEGFPDDDIYATSARRIEQSALYAVMTDDGAAGTIEVDSGLLNTDRDGVAQIRWKELGGLPAFDAEVKILADLTRKSGGRNIPNPVWKLLPADLSWLLKEQRGPLVTVHPLGGCPMGNSGATGVVDHLGRVFCTNSSNAVHDGLVVLDGSIIPTALGTNPALTIAAVSLRAAEALAREWTYAEGPSSADIAPLSRPVFRLTDDCRPSSETKVEIIERLVGPLELETSNGVTEQTIVELTLRFEPKPIAHLSTGSGQSPVLRVASNDVGLAFRSSIRIFPRDKWEEVENHWYPSRLKEKKLDAIAKLSAPLTGTLRVLERQRSCAVGRIWRAGKAWILNRGLRDLYQAAVDGDAGPGFWSRLKSGVAIASHSGEIRALVYDLNIGKPDIGTEVSLGDNRIVGRKTFTYGRRSNPWRQLMEVTLEKFPGLGGGDRGVLTLDQRYLARVGVPLFRITDQRDGVSALAELITFFGYITRLLVGIHVWSFRAPDKEASPAGPSNPWPPDSLRLSDGRSIAAEIHRLCIPAQTPDLGGEPVLGSVRLTRYPHLKTNKRSVVMFHGYSAAGTTFAHHAVTPNLASHLYESGRDVWIADLRTSPAHDRTADKAWSFDQIGTSDVPNVIATVAGHSIGGKVDVVAHCMGAVVFSIGVLEGLVPGKIDRAVLTQVGPLVVFSPANIFRSYALRYLIEFLPDNYSFNPRNPTLLDDLWDRLLSTLPYPIEEFDIENPLWPTKRTPWTRTRHRMDALYGRAFNAVNMEAKVLRHIDEHFGAMSLRTASTTMNFVRNSMMTDFHGHNRLVSRTKLSRYWKFPTLSIHGSANGLTHVATVDRMRQILIDAGRDYKPPFINKGAGHQDAIIGTKRRATFEAIEHFLDSPIKALPTKPSDEMSAYPPWIGPIITEEARKTVIRIGTLPSHRATEAAIMLRIRLLDNEILRPDNPKMPWKDSLDFITDHMWVYKSRELERCGWDAFEALPPSMTGNALLVLLVYAEAAALPPGAAPLHGYFVAEAAQQKVFRLSSIDGSLEEQKEFSFERFTKIADAVLRALVASAKPELQHYVEQDLNLEDGVIPYPATLENSRPTTITFALASCQYPAGFVDEAVAYRSYGEIVDRLERNVGPRFALFVGDQVYVDPTAGLYDPTSQNDRYRLPYEMWLRKRNVRGLLRRIPSFMLLDDHEIDDNWEPVGNPDTKENSKKKSDGLTAFTKYQRGRKGGRETFELEGLSFFMLDTRTERSHRKVGPDLDNAVLVSPEALIRLKEWLAKAPGPKFVVTPSMALPRHRRAVQRDRRLDPANLSALHSDSWDGYPSTLRDVLAYIAANEIKHVVFLSGDEHRACVATAELCDKTGTPLTFVHSVQTAAMYAPYPFANSLDEDIVENETIEINHASGSYRCIVNAKRPPAGDGATYLHLRKAGGKWMLDCEFAGGAMLTLTL